LGENINDEGAAVEHIEVENATVLMSKTRGNVRR
jgi:hypothetical protein